MIEIVRFQPEHMSQVDEQQATVGLSEYLTPEHVQILAQSQIAYTALSGDRVVACAGIVDHWPGRGEVWAQLARDLGRDFLAVHNACKRVLSLGTHPRLEAVVAEGFEAGHRWIQLLGFSRETPEPMKNYWPDGGSAVLYSRVVD